MTTDEEVFVPFPADPAVMPAASQCKSTLLVSSLRSLREHHHFERYQALLAPEYRTLVLESIAGVWVPIDAALAHYDACEALGLAVGEQVRLGLDVGIRIQRSTISTLVKLAASSGVTPWTGLRNFQRFYARVFDGGGTRVVKLGPKDARVEIVGLPLARVPYFVNGYRGVIQAGSELFARKAFVAHVPEHSAATSLAFRLAWA